MKRKNLITILWNNLYERNRRKIKEYYLLKHKNSEPLKCNFLIIDNYEPSSLQTGFRVKEFNYLLNTVKNAKLLTFSMLMYDSWSDWEKRKKDIDWSTPIDFYNYKINVKKYCDYFGEKDNSKFAFLFNRDYQAKGVYIMFLYNTYLAKNFCEKNNIPFVFTLFPGGGFKLDHEFSDYMLKSVFSSPMFKGCYIPQKIIYDYVVNKGFTTEDKLFFRYGGGFFQFTKEDVLPRIHYNEGKDTFDICFIAYRYMKKGLDKGFDLAIYSLRELIKKYPFVHLHCVGTNTLKDFKEDFSDIKNNLHIYSSQKAEFFPEFFQKMDIALAPCRPNTLDKGAFDGFPLTTEAGYFGVPIFCTDELKMNHNYQEGKELVIIKPDVEDIVAKIEYYINNLDELKTIGTEGQKKIQTLFDIHKQQADRIEFLQKYLDIELV